MGQRVVAGIFLSLLLSAAGLTAFAQPAISRPASSPETQKAPPAAPSDKPVKTSLEMNVQGVLAIGEGDDRRSSAIISLKGSKGGKAYSPGQLIDDNPDLKLLKIQNERIVFSNRGQLEFAPVKRFPDAGYGGGGSSSPSSSPSYSSGASDGGTIVADGKAAPRSPFRRPRPPRASPGAADGAAQAADAAAAPDGQP